MCVSWFCLCEKFEHYFFVHFVTTHIHYGIGITIISIIGNEQHEVKITYLLNKIRFVGKLQIIFIARVIQTMNQEFFQLIKNQSSRIRKKTQLNQYNNKVQIN